MIRKFFLTLLTFFILVLGTFHTAYSQTKAIDGWVLITREIMLADNHTIYDELYLNEQRIERNDDIIILDLLINGGPKGRFKDINTGEMKEKPAFYDYEKKYHFNSEIWKMELKCDGPKLHPNQHGRNANSYLVTFSNPRRYSERLGKGSEYTDIDIDPSKKDKYMLLHGEHILHDNTYNLIKKKFPVFCANFKEVLTDKEITPKDPEIKRKSKK